MEKTQSEIVNKILSEKEYFINCSQTKRANWRDYYEAYNSKDSSADNPFLSNLYIPKCHEAVELLAAFLAGKNQNITVSPDGRGDTMKAKVAEKLLTFQWHKVLYAHDKIVKWVKQAILFGNGFMKVGWNMEGDKDEPFMQVIGIDQLFADYYTDNLQESPVIHRIVKDLDCIKEDTRYNDNRKKLIPLTDSDIEEDETKFSNSDDTVYSEKPQGNRGELLEYWTADNKKIITIGQTDLGWVELRNILNPNKDQDNKQFKPFVKMKFKTNPLPNRMYDTGGIEPALHIQKAFNDAVREFLDNAMLINNKGWIVRKTAGISPKDLVRKPGFIIKTDDINADIRSEEVGDIKASMFDMIQFLDNEFQQASMVINLLKGIASADTATEAAIGQQNVQTMLDLVDSNIKDAFHQLGQMLMDLNIANLTSKTTIKILDDDKQTMFMDVEPETIKGKFDVTISADRPASESKAVRQKQLLDFLAIVRNDPVVMQTYPDLTIKIYKEWLTQAGFSDIDYFFEKQEQAQSDPFGLMPGGGENRGAGLTPGAIGQSANSPMINPQTNI